MKVSDGHIVRIDCELRVSGGEVIESSSKSGPVEYKHGAGQILGALEARLAGMSVDEEKSGVIPATEAFGAEGAQPTMTIPRASFPGDAKLEVGAQFEAKSPEGAPLTLNVLSVDADTVTAKAVHPLASKDLEFRVKVLAIRPPPPPVPKSTIEELEPAEITEAD
ncbi:MAG: FKBP-type peptidyl-prolyl cis-trans isomerase [Labilithrix sp.]|nr:FKBP-type peptidyl-prolyl cis-trans isomerase [Labilithrix sp.]MCW5837605.1 FKBP-type peptidyl-prolyl cis-trans isomerase [Labilithrix sp.]